MFNFFKSFKVKCDKELTEKNNWVMLGNKMQSLKFNKEIIVDENQICFLRCKDKLCDVLTSGKYKVNQENLPLLCSRLKIHKLLEKKKKPKLKTDVYFLKSQNIKFVFNFNRINRFNAVKTKEKITANIVLDIHNVNILNQFAFLENAYLTTLMFNNIIKDELFRFITKQIDAYKGELSDLMDSDIALSVQQKVEKEFFQYGVEVKKITFDNYSDSYKNKKPQKMVVKSVEKDRNFNMQLQEKVVEPMQEKMQDYKTVKQTETMPKNVEIIKSNYQQAVETGKIIINPNE